MKRGVRLAALCCAAVALGLIGTSCRWHKLPQLTLYTWADYLDPEVLEAFERAHHCRVQVDTFDSNEAMYAKLKAGQREGYDIVFPSSYMAGIMREQGWLLPLNRDKLPHLRNLNPEFMRISMDPASAYSVPYMITLTGLGYLTDRWQPQGPSWAIFGKRAFKSRMTLLNDMRETIGAALLACGLDPNTTDEGDLARAEELLLQWRDNIAKFENEQYKMGLASAEFIICHAYLGDILQTRRENSKIAFALCKEGCVASCDDLVILNTSRRAGLAHAFIDFLLEEKIAAQCADYCQFLTPNRACLPHLDKATAELHRHYLSPAVLKTAHFIKDLKEKNSAYIRVWDRVKSGTRKAK